MFFSTWLISFVFRDIMLRHLSKMHNVNGVQPRPETGTGGPRTTTPARNQPLPAGGWLAGGGVIVPRPSVPTMASPREDRQESQTIASRNSERPDNVDHLVRNGIVLAPEEEFKVQPWWLDEDLNWESFDTFLFDAESRDGPWFQSAEPEQASPSPSNYLETRNGSRVEHDAVRKAWFTYIESGDTNTVQNVNSQHETVPDASNPREVEDSSTDTIGHRPTVAQTSAPLPSTSFLVSEISVHKITRLTTLIEPVHQSVFYALCLALSCHPYPYVQTMSRKFVLVNHNVHYR